MVAVKEKNLEKINHPGENLIKMSRSKWKGLYIHTILKKKNSKKKIIKISRNFCITPALIGLTFKLHTGKIYKKLTVTEFMIYKKFGHFCFTRQNFKFLKKN